MVDTFAVLGGLEKDGTMVWRERSVMDLREEFVGLALSDEANRRELCRRFGISAQTGYKWLGRYAADLQNSSILKLARHFLRGFDRSHFPIG